MIKTKCLVLVALVVVCASGCSKNTAEGTVVGVRATVPMDQLMSGKVSESEMTFGGETVKVKLTDGKTVEAVATKEQMKEALEGKTKATLKKQDDGKWKVTKLE